MNLPPRRASPPGRDGIGWILVAAAVAVAGPRLPMARRLDDAAIEQATRRRRASWRRPAIAVSMLGETPIMATALALASARRPKKAVRDLLVLFATLSMREKACRLLRRPRPDASGWWQEPTGFSMPSRHTMTATLGLGLLADHVAGRRRGAWRRVARLGGVSVAGSRVVLGVHWPSDTVAGYLLGAGLHLATRRKPTGKEWTTHRASSTVRREATSTDIVASTSGSGDVARRCPRTPRR